MLPEGEAQAPEVFRALLAKRAPAFYINLTDQALQALARFLSILDGARRRTNLTGPLTSRELAEHALESAVGALLIPDGARVTDIGSGAGFPGIPLAIVRPDIRVTGLEPRSKRAEFLRQATRETPVENFDVLESRAGDLSGSNVWSLATARAVGQIERVLGEARFLEPQGLFLAWTTDPVALARRLNQRFNLERRVPVPESRKKVIAAFRKSDVPRGTSNLEKVRR